MIAPSESSSYRPAVSICLPVRDGAGFLSQAIESALAQRFDDFELLISDDCSSDSSTNVIEQYASRDPRIRWQRNPEPVGLFANYNRCMDLASGEYIKPFAQDDLWSPHLLSEQVRFLNNYENVALVAAQRVLINAEGHSVVDFSQEPQIIDLLGQQSVYPSEQITPACLFPVVNLIGEPCAVMFRRALRGDGFCPLFKHLGDLEYWLRILKCGDFGMIHEPLAYFRKHSGSSTDTNVKQLWVHTDIIHMADAASDLLASFDCSKERFIEHNLGYLTRILPRLDDGLPDLTAISENDNCKPSDVVALKKALLFALSMIGAKSQPSHELTPEQGQQKENAVKIERSEAILKGLLDSVSWRVTRPLREINRIAFLGPGDDDSIQLHFKQGSSLTRQRAYLRYLEITTKRILASRSWRVTRFLRKDDASTLEPMRPLAGISSMSPHESGAESIRHKQAAHTIKSFQPVERSGHVDQSQHSWKPVMLSAAGTGPQRKPYDLIMGVHAATRTGAPLLALALCNNFGARGLNCLVVLKTGGPLRAEIREQFDAIDLSESLDPEADLSSELALLKAAGLIGPHTPAYLNSAELYDLCHVFKRHDCRILSLVHEYLSNYPQFVRDSLLWNADCMVFPSSATLDDARKHGIPLANAHVIAQGLLEPGFGTKSRFEGREFLLKEFGIEPSSFVVLSCGNSDQRKGVDIFALLAADVLSSVGSPHDIHFIWVGAHAPVTFDSVWWAKHDAKKTGIADRLHFVEPQERLDSFYAGADLFLLCSRQDPMPCVMHMAQAARLPIVAFCNSGGADEALSQGGGRLIPYGDIRAMSAAIVDYYGDSQARTAAGAAGAAIVSSLYRMDTYVEQLLSLANLTHPVSSARPAIVVENR